MARTPTAPHRPLPASPRPGRGPAAQERSRGGDAGTRQAAPPASPLLIPAAPPAGRGRYTSRRRNGLPGLGPPRGTASPSHCLSASRRAPCPPSCLFLRSAPAARKRAPNRGWQRKGPARSGRTAERRDADGAACVGRPARALPRRPPSAVRMPAPAEWPPRPIRRPCPRSSESPCRCRPGSRVPRRDLAADGHGAGLSVLNSGKTNFFPSRGGTKAGGLQSLPGRGCGKCHLPAGTAAGTRLRHRSCPKPSSVFSSSRCSGGAQSPRDAGEQHLTPGAGQPDGPSMGILQTAEALQELSEPEPLTGRQRQGCVGWAQLRPSPAAPTAAPQNREPMVPRASPCQQGEEHLE